MRAKLQLTSLVLLGAFAASATFAQDYKTDMPLELTTQDKLETRLGTLEFNDGAATPTGHVEDPIEGCVSR